MTYVEYKAEMFGISIEQVNPEYTSQRCSKCGTTLRENHQSQKRFCCVKCGYEVNADYNAAKNVGLKHLRAAQKLPDGRARLNVRLNRGTLNVNGDFAPTVSDGQNGNPRENPTLNKANGEVVNE